MVVGRGVEMEGQTHGPDQSRKLVGRDRPELQAHQASGVTPAAALAFWTSVSKSVADVVYASTAV